jgi:acetyl-CoA carboxylase, biotin carboxylase subunit
VTIRNVFVANRGEIALRIIRAARALGIKTVQAVSAADKEMLAARLVDETVEIGPAHATKSYLNEAAVVEAAVASGADAVHPGYGFLAENAECAENVDGAGLIFVGPAPETIRVMGDKAMAREIAARAGAVSADMELIGQLQPHQAARFVKVDLKMALKARAEEKARLARLKRSLS